VAESREREREKEKRMETERVVGVGCAANGKCPSWGVCVACCSARKPRWEGEGRQHDKGLSWPTAVPQVD
jgi:hypothetical protein